VGLLAHLRGWLLNRSADDPARLLGAVSPAPSDRKLQLFAVACCRAVRSDLVRFLEFLAFSKHPTPRSLDAVLALVEGTADGRDSCTALHAFFTQIEGMCRSGAYELAVFRSLLPRARLLAVATGPDIVPPLPFVSHRKQCDLIREVFGHKPHPGEFSPAWRTDTVRALATQMYESREFSAMPILADALQDAGCDNDDILDHCRDPHARHVRGCWVVDLVLGKK
jgi:hypothetical protein